MSAVTVAAIATVASTAYGVYSASEAKGAAEDQQKGLADATGASSPEDLYGNRFIPEEFKSKVGTDESYAADLGAEASRNLKGSLPDLFSLTKEVNAQNKSNANAATGGQFSQVIRNSGQSINSMLKGQVPKDVVDSINRLVAEHLGGATNPNSIAGGFNMSATAADTARRLGITSFDIMQKGLSFAPAWEQTVQSFLYRPDQAAKDFLFPQISADLSASALQDSIDTSDYYSINNKIRAESSPDPQARGGLDDALKILALQSGVNTNVAAANKGVADSLGALGTSSANLGRNVSGYFSTPSAIANGTPYEASKGFAPDLSKKGPKQGTYYAG